jgi:predicted CoA-binding protein
MSKRTVAILGASRQQEKYGNKSLRAHLRRGYEVYPINPGGGTIEGLTVYKSLRDLPIKELDRISVYLPPEVTMTLVDDLLSVTCKELWLNPGSESPELIALLESRGLEPIQGCSIIDVGESPSNL